MDHSRARGGGFPQGTVTVTVSSLDEDEEEIGSESQDFIVDTIPPTITITDTGVGDDDVLNIAEQGEGITISGTAEGAEDGQEVTVTLAAGEAELEGDGSTEYTGTVSGGQWSVDIPAGSLADIEDGATVTVTANVEDAAGNPAEEAATAEFNTDLSAAIDIETIAGDPVAATDITAADRVDGFDVTGTVTDVEEGQLVTVTLNGEEFTGDVTGGEFTVPISAAFLNGLDAGPVTLNVSASVTDEAGNTATDTPAPIDADFTGPSINIDRIPTDNGDDTLNITEREDGFEISGTTDLVEAGSTVTVTVNGQDLTTTVGVDGTWSVPVAADDGGTFPPNGPVTVQATVTDNDSTLQASAVPLDLDVDLEAPEVTITDTGVNSGVGEDGVLNIAEQGEGITIRGTTTAENTQQVEVRLFDGGGTAVPGNGSGFYLADIEDGDWEVFIPPGTLDAFEGDGTIRVIADVSDAAGNEADTAEQTFDRDLTAPTISIGDISGDNQIGLLDVQGDLVITGTTNAEVGQDVTLTFNGQDFTGSVISNSQAGAEPNFWSVAVEQSAIEAIQTQADAGDGTLSDIPVTATVSDLAGNPAEAAAERTVSARFQRPLDHHRRHLRRQHHQRRRSRRRHHHLRHRQQRA